MTLGDQNAVEEPATGEGTFIENQMIHNRASFNIKPLERLVSERILWNRHQRNLCTIVPWDRDFVVTDCDPRFQCHEFYTNRQGKAFAVASIDKAIFALLNSQPGRLGRSSLLDAKCNSARFEPLSILRVGPLLRFGQIPFCLQVAPSSKEK